VTAITEYLRLYNQAPTRFVWTKAADMILGKIHSCKEALGTPLVASWPAALLATSHRGRH
jgi:hypothetical protein